MWGRPSPKLVEAIAWHCDHRSVVVHRRLTSKGRLKPSRRPAQEADLRGYLLEVCAAFPRHHRHRQGSRGLCGRRCVRNFSQTKREAGVCACYARCDPFDYATLMVEILKDNARRRPVPFTALSNALGQARGAGRASLRQMNKATASKKPRQVKQAYKASRRPGRLGRNHVILSA